MPLLLQVLGTVFWVAIVALVCLLIHLMENIGGFGGAPRLSPHRWWRRGMFFGVVTALILLAIWSQPLTDWWRG